MLVKLIVLFEMFRKTLSASKMITMPSANVVYVFEFSWFQIKSLLSVLTKMTSRVQRSKLRLWYAVTFCYIIFSSTCVISAPIFVKVGFILDRNRVPETDNLYLSLNYLKQKYSQDNIDFRWEQNYLFTKVKFSKKLFFWANCN